MVGGIDMGPTAPLEGAARILTTLYSDIADDRRPILIFAGNQEARRSVADQIGDLLDLRVVDNVRPSVQNESITELQRELAKIYGLTRLPQIPGYRRLRRWCTSPILSTQEALGNTLRFVARRNELSQGVLGIDIGGRSTYVGAARDVVYQWVMGSQMGTSRGVLGIMRDSHLADLERWIPVPIDRQEIIDRIENAHLRPQSIPQSMEDLFIAHALARQASLLTIRRLREQFWRHPERTESEVIVPPFDLIMARGGVLSHTPQDGLLALTLLDAIQPVGLTRLVIDWASIWPQLGALAQVVPLAAAQVLERDALHELGPVIAPKGIGREGERALTLRIIEDDGSQVEADIMTGTIQRFPLPLDKEVRVQVQPSRAFDIGLGRKGIGGETRIRGGSLGLIVDTRGRPLLLPQDREHCRAKLQEWLGNMIHDVDDSL